MTTTRDIKHNVQRYLARDAAPAAEPAKPAPPMPKITANMLARAKQRPSKPAMTTFAPASHPPSVEKHVVKERRMATDEALLAVSEWGNTAINEWANQGYFSSAYAEGVTFLGFPYLAELAQRPEYRRMSERIATEMTRKWIRITTSAPSADGEVDKQATLDRADRVKKIEDELRRLKAREAFRRAAEHDGFFGRGHIFIDLGDQREIGADGEIASPLGDGSDATSKAKVKLGGLKRLTNVEPVWVYPTTYNTTDPLAADFYKPTVWNTQGRQIHASRLLTFVGREVPDMLKPAYSFGGLSMSQMAKPYVDNWLRTRQAVSDLIESFSVSGLLTDLSSLMQGGGDQLFERVDLFNSIRSNRGTMILNKGTEEFFNITTPLSGLDALQAQSQEHMSAVSGIPLIILLGIQPMGLNASSEGEIRVFYDFVHAFQELLFADNLRKLIRLVQLSLFGSVDDAIGFVFEPLWSMDEKGQAEVRKIDAETGTILIDAGVISSAEERKRVVGDEDSLYHGLDVDNVPDATPEEADGLDPDNVDDGSGDEPDDGVGALDAEDAARRAA